MGPTFVKLGQLLSSRADLLPMPYLDALARLQDRVEPFSFCQVEATSLPSWACACPKPLLSSMRTQRMADHRSFAVPKAIPNPNRSSYMQDSVLKLFLKDGFVVPQRTISRLWRLFRAKIRTSQWHCSLRTRDEATLSSTGALIENMTCCELYRKVTGFAQVKGTKHPPRKSQA